MDFFFAPKNIPSSQMPAVQLEHTDCLLLATLIRMREQITEGWPLTSHQGRQLRYVLLPFMDFRFPSMFPLLPYLPSRSLIKYVTISLRRWAEAVPTLAAQTGGQEFEPQASRRKLCMAIYARATGAEVRVRARVIRGACWLLA